MGVYTYSGLPGKGKTFNATLSAYKHYKSQNTYIEFLRYYLPLRKKIKYRIARKSFKNNPINKIYSNYPILLDKKRNIYSHPIQPSMMMLNYQFPKGSLIVLDEIQRYFDSRDFKEFPKKLGIFFQHHRHGSIDRIIVVSQSPSRIDTKMRLLSEVYRKYKVLIIPPFLPFGLMSYTDYYEYEDYGKSTLIDKKLRTYDAKHHITLFMKKNVIGRYDSKYFRVIFENLPDVPDKQFQNINLTINELSDVGLNDM